jgi:hypothetical protein
MSHVNAQTLRGLPAAEFAALARPILLETKVIDASVSDARLAEVLGIVQEKVISLEHLPEFMGFFFTADFKKDEGAMANLTKKGGDPRRPHPRAPARPRGRRMDRARPRGGLRRRRRGP